MALTGKNEIVGTLYYMSPEQLQSQATGKEIDSRSDIFSFGLVLYELITGKRAFEGSSPASVIAAIMERPAPSIADVAPAALDRVLKKCLAKDPDERWQSARDLKDELQWIASASGEVTAGSGPSKITRGSRLGNLVWPSLAALLLMAAAGISVAHFREMPPKAQPVRFAIFPPEKTTFNSVDMQAFSPDGTMLAFTAGGADGTIRLYIRPLDALVSQPLPGTEGASLPFWSPDSRSIAFFAQGKLKKIDAHGGPPLTLCEAPGGRAGAWNREGVILFRPGPNQGIYQVSEAGGEAKPVTTLDASRQEVAHTFPQFLPDGRHFIYTALSGAGGANFVIFAASLDSKETKRLLVSNSQAVYAAPPAGGPGHLLYLRGDTLMAQPFDAGALAVRGEPFPVAEQVQIANSNTGAAIAAVISVSENGAVAYRRGSNVNTSELAWFDRSGKRLGNVGEPADYSNPALSPDEKKLAIGRMDPQAKTRDIWVFDLQRGASSRFTFDAADDINPTWAPDGSRIAFTSDRKGRRDIYQKAASGAGQDELLLESGDMKALEDWSPDGKTILFNDTSPKHPPNIWMFTLDGGGKSSAAIESPFAVAEAQLSANGRWIAYRSNESGKFETYVQSFPPSGGKWQVSTNGGDEPRWRRDGKELFYLAADNRLMAVDVKTDGPTFEAGIPKPLFEIRRTAVTRRNHYLAASNGQRFLAVLPVEETTTPSITVVLNWLAGVKR